MGDRELRWNRKKRDVDTSIGVIRFKRKGENFVVKHDSYPKGFIEFLPGEGKYRAILSHFDETTVYECRDSPEEAYKDVLHFWKYFDASTGSDRNQAFD